MVDEDVRRHRLVLLRHGETEWSRSGLHTGHTDLDLTDIGRQRAALTAAALGDLTLENPLVVSSPMRRAQATAELAGLAVAGLGVAEVSPLLAEWDYGDLFVGHGHFSRAMITRWVELPVTQELSVTPGIRFAMAPASVAVCGFEHGVRQVSALGLTGHRHPGLP